jgi:hypothetical protein
MFLKILVVEKTDEFKYKLSGKNIERVQKEKDIGVTIDSELTFESHICEKVNKATQIFGAYPYKDKDKDVSVCSIIYHFLAIGSCTKSLLCVIH